MAADRDARRVNLRRQTLRTAVLLAGGPFLAGAVIRLLASADLIPDGLVPRLATLTILLALALSSMVIAFRSRIARLASLPRWLGIGAAVALPAGLGLLVLCETAFVVRVPLAGGRMAVEIVAPPHGPSCCPGILDDAECLRYELSRDPMAIEKCWERSRVRRNRFLWSASFLLAAGGFFSLAALPWCRTVQTRAAASLGSLSKEKTVRQGLFLSYASEDREFAERLAHDLSERGIPVWWDQWEMEIGDSLPQRIEDAVARSRWLGIVLSPESVSSRWVRAELDLALTLEIEDQDMTILPILLRPCEVPLSLRRKVWADFTISYESGFKALLQSLSAEERSHGTAPRPGTVHETGAPP